MIRETGDIAKLVIRASRAEGRPLSVPSAFLAVMPLSCTHTRMMPLLITNLFVAQSLIVDRRAFSGSIRKRRAFFGKQEEEERHFLDIHTHTCTKTWACTQLQVCTHHIHVPTGTGMHTYTHTPTFHFSWCNYKFEMLVPNVQQVDQSVSHQPRAGEVPKILVQANASVLVTISVPSVPETFTVSSASLSLSLSIVSISYCLQHPCHHHLNVLL